VRTPKKLPWAVIAPVGLLAVALASLAWLDLTTGGEAKPEPYLGKIGTPVRGTFVPATPTPPGAAGTPRPRPTFAGVAQGTSETRDTRRRNDLLALLGAADQYRKDNGEYPTTGGNLQSLCVYKDIDAGCKLAPNLGGKLPEDPFGDPTKNGYWFESSGQRIKFYAALEGDIPDTEKCPTSNVDLRKKQNLICVEAP